MNTKQYVDSLFRVPPSNSEISDPWYDYVRSITQKPGNRSKKPTERDRAIRKIADEFQTPIRQVHRVIDNYKLEPCTHTHPGFGASGCLFNHNQSFEQLTKNIRNHYIYQSAKEKAAEQLGIPKRALQQMKYKKIPCKKGTRCDYGSRCTYGHDEDPEHLKECMKIAYKRRSYGKRRSSKK